MNAYASMVVFDTRDIRLSVAASEEAIRNDLLEFANDQLTDADLDELPESTGLDEIAQTLLEEFGWHVLTEPTFVMGAGA
jgi:hypothetical protein